MNKTLRSILVAAAVLGMTSAGSHGAELYYHHETEGSWFATNNWIDDVPSEGVIVGRLPTANDQVRILNGWAPQDGVTVDAPGAECRSLLVGLWGSAGTLTVEAAGTLDIPNSRFELRSHTVGKNALLVNHGQITTGTGALLEPVAGSEATFVNTGVFATPGGVYATSGTTSISNSGTFSCGGIAPEHTNMTSFTVHNTGAMNITDGFLYLSAADGTNCTWNMLGGEINVANHIAMPPGGSAHLNLHGGTITTPSIELQTNGNYTIDVRWGGELVIHGNQTNELNQLVGLGLVTASAGSDVFVQYAAGKTTLTATVPNPVPGIEGGNTGWVFYGEPAGTFVGPLSMAYPETGETYSYSFDPSMAGNANADFTISGSNLLTAASLEAGTYPICLIGTDTRGRAFTNRAAVVKVKDEIARIEIQQGRFVMPRTGAEFAPTGFNYIKLRDKGPGEIAHSTFDPAFYDRVEVEAMFADLEANGFNTVRVFLDPVSPLPAVSLFESSASTGLSPVYMNNVYDFLRRAGNHGIYVIVGFSMWGPSASYLHVGGSSPMVTGPNNLYFRDGAAETRAALVAEVAAAIKAHDPKLLPVVLAYEPQNELCYFVDQEPLSLTEGIFTYQGQTYDLSSAAQVRDLLDAVSVYWCNTSVQAVQAVDPRALVSIDVFTYHAVGRTDPDGHLDESADNRVPARPLALAGSDMSYLDIHLYHEDMGPDLASIEIEETLAACAGTGKPLLMGEFGNHSAATAADASRMLEQHVANANGYGFSGFLLWTYDLPGRWWSAKHGSGDVLQALKRAAQTNYPASQFEPPAIQAVGTDVEVQWNTAVGESYQLLHSPHLAEPVWASIGVPRVGTGSSVTNSVPVDEGQGFYKVRKNN